MKQEQKQIRNQGNTSGGSRKSRQIELKTADRQKLLKIVVREKRKQLNVAPDGYLRISSTPSGPQYYHVASKDRGPGTYLSSKKDEQAIRKLAQKSYDRKVLRAAEQELKAWQQLTRLFPGTTIEEVYDTLAPARQSIVTPISPTDEEYCRQWEAVEYEPGYFKVGAPEYYTDRGERVRSKTEQLIANLLYRLRIPYRYEYPVTIIKNGRPVTWRPDFLILDVTHRKEFILEHFGMLSDPDYAANAFEKMHIYEQNGLFEGQGICYTFEADKAPVDMRYVERKIRRIMADEGGGLPQSFRDLQKVTPPDSTRGASW